MKVYVLFKQYSKDIIEEEEYEDIRIFGVFANSSLAIDARLNSEYRHILCLKEFEVQIEEERAEQTL
ncbi:hypothetical protein KJ781_05475 [Patescibacteria group bacterium]|nr:hypothetical protein [Patescibacteria group bacterium]MBU1449269.1 hypothetical protein [Patescibacteria group bacterium]